MKNKIKKLLYLFLIIFVFVLTSCSSDSNGDLGGPNEPGNNVVIETTRKIYYTVNYSIESNEYDEIKKKISAEVGKYNGYVQSSSDTNNFSEYVYKVPTEVLNSFLDYIDSFGNDVSNKNVQSMDITTEYSDIEARKEVLTASRQSYLNLLSKEDFTKTEIITIQNKISEIDSELAS
ncbi:MAG: DUF4349 domain-containing protein, partial [Anaeroplasmataceae bacterium]|nr:DUF4349 domain-containing protein [Anaeroplasmataceae bacterium]